jgi:predicted GTPase
MIRKLVEDGLVEETLSRGTKMFYVSSEDVVIKKIQEMKTRIVQQETRYDEAKKELLDLTIRNEQQPPKIVLFE